MVILSILIVECKAGENEIEIHGNSLLKDSEGIFLEQILYNTIENSVLSRYIRKIPVDFISWLRV